MLIVSVLCFCGVLHAHCFCLVFCGAHHDHCFCLVFLWNPSETMSMMDSTKTQDRNKEHDGLHKIQDRNNDHDRLHKNTRQKQWAWWIPQKHKTETMKYNIDRIIYTVATLNMLFNIF
jgi:hypothetical protein